MTDDGGTMSEPVVLIVAAHCDTCGYDVPTVIREDGEQDALPARVFVSDLREMSKACPKCGGTILSTMEPSGCAEREAP